MLGPAPAARAPRWALLAGAAVGVPLVVAALAAGLTAALPCDTSGLVVLVAGAFGALALGSLWGTRCAAHGWWLFGALISAGTLGSLAGAAAWAAVALDRCFTF
jgi:hypothetical protein